MRRFTIPTLLCSGCCAASLSAATVQNFQPTSTGYRTATAVQSAPARATAVTPARNSAGQSSSRFTYRDSAGEVNSAPVVPGYQPNKLVYPLAKVDPRLSPTLTRAATIAQERAYAHSKSRCWHYVKEALLAAGAVDSRPKSVLAKQAAAELTQVYGFKRLPIRDPYAAPVGAVLVYGASRAAGHVEIRTKTGFVSDFRSPKPSKRPLIGAFVKA